jgi:hypothetical protein
MPDFAFCRFRPVFDFGHQRRLNPNPSMRYPLIQLGFDLAPALRTERSAGWGPHLFLAPLMLILRNRLCLRRRRGRRIFRFGGGCSQFGRRCAVTGPELSAPDRSDELAAHRWLYLNSRFAANWWFRRDVPLSERRARKYGYSEQQSRSGGIIADAHRCTPPRQSVVAGKTRCSILFQ